MRPVVSSSLGFFDPYTRKHGLGFGFVGPRPSPPHPARARMETGAAGGRGTVRHGTARYGTAPLVPSLGDPHHLPSCSWFFKFKFIVWFAMGFFYGRLILLE
jgi:hypothetical protein